MQQHISKESSANGSYRYEAVDRAVTGMKSQTVNLNVDDLGHADNREVSEKLAA